MADLKQPTIHEEIEKALQTVAYGSIEIYVQNKVVTQITVRNIKKTSVSLASSTTNSKRTITINKTSVKKTAKK